VKGEPAAVTDRCYRHPDKEAPYYCQKDNVHMCEECACCHSPRIYCQYRTACVINLLTKDGDLSPCDEDAGAVEKAAVD
jgi:hypothetical protein